MPVDQKQIKDQTGLGRTEQGTNNKKTITIPSETNFGVIQINSSTSQQGWHGINFHQPWNTKSKNWCLMTNYYVPSAPTIYQNFFGWFDSTANTWSFYCHDGNMFATSYGYLSDKSKKRDIKELPSVLDRFKKIKPVSYRWTTDLPDSDETRLGFLAQSVLAEFPEAVRESTDPFNPGLLVMDSNQLTAILWKAVLELTEKVVMLETRLPSLR